MGLVFPLQPDLRKSTSNNLVVKSTKRKFGLGGSFVFGGALLGTMFLAASPLFKIFWTQGNFFDKIITILVVTPIVMYPILAAICWFYEEVVLIHRDSAGTYRVSALEKVFGIKWNRREMRGVNIKDLQVENWVGSRNVAALGTKPDRYATKGHWMLKWHQGDRTLLLERRAKRDEIDLLRMQIESYFGVPADA